MKESKCIICNETAEIVIENFNGYKEGEKFNIYHCSLCNTSFASPHEVDDKIYDYIYSHAQIVPGYNRYAVYANEIKNQKNALNYLAGKEAMYFAIRNLFSEFPNKKIKILEVGSGLGYLTYAIDEQGFDIKGLDISAKAIESSRKHFGENFICDDVHNYSLHNPEKFDVVVLTEVIEHVPCPKDFCNLLLNLLKPQGKLIITTPNKSAYPKNELWYTELPPVHLTWFSEDSFKKISQKLNTGIQFFDFSGFNKKHIDITKYKYYSRYIKRNKMHPTLAADGSLLHPTGPATNKFKKIRSILKKKLRIIIDPFLIRFFTDKSYPGRNNILCVILQKK